MSSLVILVPGVFSVCLVVTSPQNDGYRAIDLAKDEVSSDSLTLAPLDTSRLSAYVC